MFGDLLGNFQEKQKQIQEKLDSLELTGKSTDGAVEVIATANRKIKNINIDMSKLDLSSSDQLEDLLVVTINNVMDEAAIEAEKASKEMMNDMLPPGMGGLSNLFQ